MGKVTYNIPNPKYISENTKPVIGQKLHLRTAQPFSYSFGKLKITVPKGYVTDGASIPQFALFLMSFVRGYSSDRFSDEWISAAIVHDYMTQYKYDRRTSDAIFHSILVETTDRFTAFVMWLAVRFYGIITNK